MSPSPRSAGLTRLSRLRLARGFTQQDLARRAGVSVSHLRRLERGEHPNARVGDLRALADALDCSAIELIEGISLGRSERLHSRARFEIAKAFPAGSVVARWLTVLGMAMNDLAMYTARLYENLESGAAPPYENVTTARLAASHLYEAAKFLDRASTRFREVASFIAELPEERRADYELVISAGPRASGRFAQTSERVRNLSFHYVEMLVDVAAEHEHLLQSMRQHAEDGTISEISLGDSLLDFRALFADDVAAEMLHPGDHRGATSEFITELANASMALQRFGQAAFQAYLSELAPEVLTIEDGRGPST